MFTTIQFSRKLGWNQVSYIQFYSKVCRWCIDEILNAKYYLGFILSPVLWFKSIFYPSTWLQHLVGWARTAKLNNVPELILWVPTWRWFQQETGWRLWWAAGGPLRSSPSHHRLLLRWPARHCGPPAWPGSPPPSPSAAGRSPPAPGVRSTEELVHLLSCAGSHDVSLPLHLLLHGCLAVFFGARGQYFI